MDHIENANDRAVTFRAVVIGAALSCFLGYALPYAGCVLRGSRMGMSTATPAAFFLLFVLMLFVQPFLRMIGPRWPLNRGEALTVFIMTVVATALPTRRVAWGLGMITGTFYWGNASNQWIKLVWPHTTPGLVVSNPAATRQFYEGNVPWADVDWSAWIPPLLHWALFLLAFHLVLISLMVILRRQWVENEKLSYPVTIVPIEMMKEPEKGRWLGPFFRSPLMWLGFAFPFVIESLNCLHRYFPGAGTQVNLHFGYAILLSRTVWIPFRINFLMMGLAFFIETRLLFSMFAFYLVMQYMRGYLRFMGAASSVDLGNWTEGRSGGVFAYMMMGAIIV